MEEFLSTVVTAVVMGATAMAKEVATEAVRDAYNALKAGIIRKLGRQGAVQSVEDDPESQSARTTLVEALARKALRPDEELGELAASVIQAAGAQAGQNTDHSIQIDKVRGAVGAIVEHLSAAGRIKVGEVVADQGTARVSHLSAGTDIAVEAPRKGGEHGGFEKN